MRISPDSPKKFLGRIWGEGPHCRLGDYLWNISPIFMNFGGTELET